MEEIQISEWISNCQSQSIKHNELNPHVEDCKTFICYPYSNIESSEDEII